MHITIFNEDDVGIRAWMNMGIPPHPPLSPRQRGRGDLMNMGLRHIHLSERGFVPNSESHTKRGVFTHLMIIINRRGISDMPLTGRVLITTYIDNHYQ